ncbi:MAG: glycosyltransferase family protein [Colwellia sp.]|nr:glycosyltransferase family protein [Colwellia sp.]
MKVLAITQARMGSSRLPGKILKQVEGKTLLEIHIARILLSEKIDKLIVATTTNESDLVIVEVLSKLGVDCYRGSESDVLDRFYKAAEPETPDYVVRFTSDCPLLDPHLIDAVIVRCVNGEYDYTSNARIPTYPDGLDVEVFTFAALKKSWVEAKSLVAREHVTPYMWENSTLQGKSMFTSCSFENDIDLSHHRITVDTPEDLIVIETLIKKLGVDRKWMDYVNYLEQNREVFKINSHLIRNKLSHTPLGDNNNG